MRLGLWLSCLYVFAAFFRPQELFLTLRDVPNFMSVLGWLAVSATLLDVLMGARPSLRLPQVLCIVLFVLWAAFTIFAVYRWLGGAADALVDLSANAWVFLLAVFHGSEVSRLTALRRAAIAALLVTIGFGLRAYYLGPGRAEFVLYERSYGASAQGDAPPASALGGLAARLTGRGAPAQEGQGDTVEPSDAGDSADAPNSATQTATGTPRLRALGFLNDPNDLAQGLVATIPLVFLGWRSGHWFMNFVLVGLPAGLMLWAIALTRSRGGLVALAALVWLAAGSRASLDRERRFRWLGLAALFPTLIIFFRAGGADSSAAGRLDAWSEGLQMLKSSPIWGIGFNSFKDEHELVAHNSFVHCFAELGLVGYALWLAAILASFWYFDRMRATEDGPGGRPELVRWSRALSLSLGAFLTGALFLSRSYSVALFFLLGLATALASVAKRTSVRPEQYALPPATLASRTAVWVVASVVLTYATVVLGR